jgi:hypothetical protein
MNSKKWVIPLLLVAVFLMIAAEAFAQNYYDVSFRQRRLGNQIGVEVWVKSATTSAPNLGNMSIAVTYNTDFLTPVDPGLYTLGSTDSVDYDVNQTSPYKTITSPFNSTNGYNALAAQATNIGGVYTYQLDVNLATLGTSGYQPSTSGRGSFVGILKFDITNHASITNTTLANIAFNTSTMVGDFRIFDLNGTDVESNTTVVAIPSLTVRGITIINPNGPNESLNRNKTYPCLSTDGYPIYFERSGLITPAVGNEYGTNVLAYNVQYSVDNGATYSSEVMRFAETRLELSDITKDYHMSGEIASTTGSTLASGSTGYLVTQGDGSQLPVVSSPGYGGILRIIWNSDPYFAPRSEQALLKISQLPTTGTSADIDNRTLAADAVYDVSDLSFVLSRLFFLQLNGTNGYLRSRDNYSNATQLTVEAWVNLNEIQTTVGAEPGIVVCSPGPAKTDEEGPWMLYLAQGKYPAFRAREIIGGAGRGENGGAYVATVVSPDALTATSDATPINSNTSHPGNWVHISATVNNGTVSLYVDGELKANTVNSNAVNIRMATYTQPVWIGVNPNGGIQSMNYLHAGIKEVRVWRKALTQTNIRERMAGVNSPTSVSAGDLRSSLELYYDFVGTYTDKATATVQNGTNPINYYNSPLLSAASDNTLIRFRPDRAHLKLTSPVAGSGVQNLSTSTFDIRWAAYGIGDNSTTSQDIAIEFSRNGTQWVKCIDNSNPAGDLLDQVEIEASNSSATWMPYRHATVSGAFNDLQSIVPVETEYAKTVTMRIRGTGTDDGTTHNQQDITYTSGEFTVAPYFALKNTGGSIVSLPTNSTTNLTGGAAFVEAWIRPYRFPTTSEGYFPIINKLDSTTGTLHYSLRLLSTGQLQFRLGKSDGTVLTATSDINRSMKAPNVEVYDSTWYHVGVLLNLANGSGSSSCKFYIDGNVQAEDSIATQLGSNVAVNALNEYPTYFMYEPGTTPADSRYFYGEMKEVRFWNGVPADMAITGTEPTAVTSFIRGAATVRATELLTTPTDYTANLAVSFSMNGGGFVRNDYIYNGALSPFTSAADGEWAQIRVNNGVSFTATRPLIKMVEPTFLQEVPNTTTNLNVRWTGFDFERNMFRTGDNVASQNSDLEYSTFGGGNVVTIPYNPTASDNDNTSFTPDALTLPSTSAYSFNGIAPPYVQFGGTLNVYTSNPDVNSDGTKNDRGPVAATLTNARLRMAGRAILNSIAPYEYSSIPTLRGEGPLFTITPASNFTVRAILEGHHTGTANGMNDIGTSYATGGVRIKLYQNSGGLPGALVATGESSQRYSETDPTANPVRNLAGSVFADIPFVFTSLTDGRYWVVVEQINHLPVMSKYTAPFAYSGDDNTTWGIESGWDFQNWNGSSTNVLTEAESIVSPYPTITTKYTAYGYSETDTSNSNYGSTGLIYNDGSNGNLADATSMAGLVGGDVEHDGKINAADRVKVRIDEAGTATYASDVTGDGFVNATDRQIVDRNNNKTSSIANLTFQTGTTQGGGVPALIARPYNPYEVISPANPELSMLLNQRAKEWDENGKRYVDVAVKGSKTQAAGTNYKVWGVSELKDDKIEVSVYIQNEGDDWAPANCTFAINYDPNLLTYNSLVSTENSLWSNNPTKGYVGVIHSAPRPTAPNPLPDVRTIEIDYDNYARTSGVLVPHAKTLVGTLVFSIRNASDSYEFKWHASSAIHKTTGENITKDGTFDKITKIVVTTQPMVVAPNGGETWKGGRPYSISWTKSTSKEMVYVEYSIDNGASWSRISTTPVEVSALNLDWNAPKVRSTECLIRLVKSSDGSEFDRSDNMFSLLPASASISRPASADPIYQGYVKDQIKWTVEDPTSVRFEFSDDGVNNWQKVTSSVNSVTGQIDWTVPAVNTKNAVIAMYDSKTDELLAVSEPFKVLAGDVTLITPSSNATVDCNKTTSVRWTSNNVANFDLELSLDGGLTWSKLEYGINATKSAYSWNVPNVNSDHAIIRSLWNHDADMEYDRTPEFRIVGTVGVEDALTFTVGTAYPNPFNSTTQVSFTLPEDGAVYASVYNAQGMKVADVLRGRTYAKGTYTLTFGAEDFPSGVYFLRLSSGANTDVQELRIVK